VGRQVTIWADKVLLHVLLNGTRLKTLPSRLGYQLAGQRVTLRMDGTQMTVISHDGLAADSSQGVSRQPLIAMLWRVKTPAAVQILLDALGNPDTALVAMSALRRRLGSTQARQHIAPLLTHPDQRVRQAARQQLHRIDKRS